MATVKITHKWADESETEMVVSSPGPGYPDLLASLRGEALLLWRETCCAQTDPAAGADVDRIVNGGPDADE